MAKVYEAYVKYSADVSQLWQQTSGIRGRLVSSLSSAGTAAGKAFSTALTTAAGVGLAGLAASGVAAIAIAKKSIEAAVESEKQTKRLAAVLRATGGAAGFTAEQLTAYASELQASTAFSDDAIVESMSVLATFKNVSGDVFKSTIVAAMDMSEVLGTDLKGATLQIAKALQDPIAGMTALRRSGVSFSKEQRDLAKTLVESGRLFEAQKMILDELSSEFGGAAKAALGTYAGAWLNLQNQLDDASKTIGFAILPHLREFGPLIQAGADGIAVFAGELASAISAEKLGGLEDLNDTIAQSVALVLSLGDAWKIAANEAGGLLVDTQKLIADFLKWGNTPIFGGGDESNSPAIDAWQKRLADMQAARDAIRDDLGQSVGDRFERVKKSLETTRARRESGGAAAATTPAGPTAGRPAPKLPFNPLDILRPASLFGGGGGASKPSPLGGVPDLPIPAGASAAGPPAPVAGGLLRGIGAGIGAAGLATAGAIGTATSGIGSALAAPPPRAAGGGTGFVGLADLNSRIQSGIGKGSKGPSAPKFEPGKASERIEKLIGKVIEVIAKYSGVGP